jgi:YVTN family beta-propeller protein
MNAAGTIRRGFVQRMRRRAMLAIALVAVSGPLGSVGAQDLAVVSQQGARVSRIAGGAVTAALAVTASPAVVAADASGRLYISHPDGHAITVVAPDGSARHLPFAGQAFGLAVEPDGRAIYVGDWSGNRVVRIAPSDGAVEGEVAVGRDPANLTLGEDGRLYVAERESRSVGVIDTRRMVRVAALSVGDGPFALTYDPIRRRLYVANVRSNDMTVVDTAGGRILATVPAGPSPYGVAVSADGARIVVTDQHAASVSVIDADALSITATVPVGKYPEGVVIRGDRAYVANWFSDDIAIVDLTSLTTVGRIPVAEGPRSIVAVPPAAAASTLAGRATPGIAR